MTASTEEVSSAVYYTFAVFVLALSFSIALAQIALGVSLVLFIFAQFSRRNGPSIVGPLKWAMWIAIAYIAWLVFTCLIGSTPLASLEIAREEWLFLIVPIGITVLRDPKRRAGIILFLATGAFVIALYAISQHWTGYTLFRTRELVPAPDSGYRVAGFFAHRLTFANVFSVTGIFLWAFAFRKETWAGQALRRWFILLAAIAAMVASALTYSRGPIAAIIIGLILTALIGGRKYAWRSVGIVVVAVTALLLLRPGLTARFSESFQQEVHGTYEGSRLYIWKHSLQIIEAHPIFGVGKGNFKPEYGKLLGPDVPAFRIQAHAHNDVLTVMANSGIPGALLFVALWAAVLTGIIKLLRYGRGHPALHQWALAALVASIVFLINSLFEATFADEEVRQILMFVWAAGLWPYWSGQGFLVNTSFSEPEKNN